MTARIVIRADGPDLHAAVEAAKAQAKADGHRIRTVSRVTRHPDGGFRVELSVDPTTHVGGPLSSDQGGGGDVPPPARPSSWVREARADAIAWREGHVAKGGT